MCYPYELQEGDLYSLWHVIGNFPFSFVFLKWGLIDQVPHTDLNVLA